MTDQGKSSEETLQPPTQSIRPSVSQRKSDQEVCGSDVDPMVAVYRHDIHKTRLRSYEYAEDSFFGIRVNEAVPLGADRDAALLSRPKDPDQTLDAHKSWFRMSRLTGQRASTVEPVTNIGGSLYDVICIKDPKELHATWLDASVPALFAESRFYPYTSLKYHTLLTAALLDNYRSGVEFDELFLAVSERDRSADSEVIPHRTVLSMPGFALHVTSDPNGRPAARIGDVPSRSFADVWERLPTIPLDVDEERRWRALDAQLRRVRSWSVALQYIEEYVSTLGPAGSGDPDDGGGAAQDA